MLKTVFKKGTVVIGGEKVYKLAGKLLDIKLV